MSEVIHEIDMKEELVFSELDHICIVTKDLDKNIRYYESLGIGPFKPIGPVERFDFKMLMHGKSIAPDSYKVEPRIARVGLVKIELVQPISGNSLWQEFLETRGEGIMHLAFKVDDVEKEEGKLVKNGLELIFHVRFRTSKGCGGVSYFDTRKVGGVIFEIVQWAPGMILV
ncbi:MAG: VOC family protein [Dehalococcoidales bacterium]|nr:VOC family protein [Dehalococcoidales bacterium]